MSDKVILSTYTQDARTAQTFVRDRVFGAEFHEAGKVLGEEMYPGKSEQWAENCAENFVLGIKQLDKKFYDQI